MQITVQKIADTVGGKVIGNADAIIDRPSKIEEATSGSISFMAHEKYLPFLESSDASAYIVSTEFDTSTFKSKTFIKVENVYGAISKLLAIYDSQNNHNAGIASTAVISDRATIGNNVSIGDYVKPDVQSIEQLWGIPASRKE